MYSAQQEAMMRNSERESFKKIKEKENATKDMNLLEDILYTNDFTFKKYRNSGDSGDLLIATNKKNKEEKYIIKHEYYDCACNEYIYSKIGNEMGIDIAPVKLFLVTDKNKIFKSDFVCGIKYYENGKAVGDKYIQDNKESIGNWKDYFKFRGMEALFCESDDIEIIKANRKIHRIDTTAAFLLSHTYISHVAYDFEFDGINIKKTAEERIIKLANFDINQMIQMWNISKNNFIENDNSNYLEYYLEPFYLFLKIEDEKIEKWCDNISYIYPEIIAEHYKIYFNNIKKCLKHFLNEIQK